MAAIGCTTFVASIRPPIPTSSTAISLRAWRKAMNAMSVSASKYVGVIEVCFAASRSSSIDCSSR